MWNWKILDCSFHSSYVLSYYARWHAFSAEVYTKDKSDSKLVDLIGVKRKLQKIPEDFYTRTGLPVITPENFPRWLTELVQKQTMLFQELMSGSGRLSYAGFLARPMVGCPIDYRYQWNLGRAEHQHLVDVLTTKVDYSAPNCGPWSILGGWHPDATKQRTRELEHPALKWLAKRAPQRHKQNGTAAVI